MSESLATALAERCGPNPAVVESTGSQISGSHLSGDLLQDRTVALAANLESRGVGPGDRVAFVVGTTARGIVTYRACWWLGATAVAIHPRAGSTEIADLVDRVAPTVTLAPDELDPDAWLDLVDGDYPDRRPAPVADDHDAVVLFTSGSSGRPKGVRLTDAGLRYKGRQLIDVHGLAADDVWLMPAPLAHVSGLLHAVLLPGLLGARVVLMDRWDPDDALELIEVHEVTTMVGPPTFFVGLMGAAGFTPERVASLRLLSVGGAGVTPAFVDEAAAALDCVVKRSYGSTEAPTVATSHADDPPTRRATTDGRAFAPTELRLGDEDEIQVRGPEVTPGYLDPEDDAAAFTPDGWFRTGDLGSLDDGWLTVAGRLDDTIIRGGENISAAAVEAVLERHPEVRAAAVVGRPDELMGERVAAFLLTDSAMDVPQLSQWFDDQGASRLLVPEQVECVQELPTLASGKVDRAALRRQVGAS